MSARLLNSEPLYVQLRTALARRIASGDWKPGETIPNELDLAKEYGLSAGTVRKALDWMEEAKLISRQQGRGTFVTDPASKESSRRFNRLRQADGSPVRLERTQLSVTIGAASEIEQERLRLSPGESVARVRLLSSVQGKPVLYEEAMVPTARFPSLVDRPDPAQVYDLLELAHRNGVLIGKGEERISTVVADKTIAGHLQVAADTILVVFDRTVLSIEEHPIEWRTTWANLGDNYYLSVLN